MDFQDSKTFTNLQTALENELQSSALYSLYRKRSDQEVYLEISSIFATISRNAEFIAERLRRILNTGDTNTFQNLIDAANQEQSIANNMYNEFSRIAKEEGYTDLSALFTGIANIKLSHYSTLQNLAINMDTNQLFCKNQEILWICMGCGNILSGTCTPEICPICGYPQGYYRAYRRPI